MATLAELLRGRTLVPRRSSSICNGWSSSWGILSDLSFSDLLLFVPISAQQGGFVVVGQVRPTTSQTLHLEDLLGREVGDNERPLLARACALGSVVEGEVPVTARSERARVVCIPVRVKGDVVAVLTREAPLIVGRRAGRARARLCGRVRPPGPDGRGRDLPVPGRRAHVERGAPGR